jgi:hypothetical protein
MLIQTTQQILDYMGEPIPNGTKDGATLNLQLRDAVFLVLNNYAEGETPTGDQKLQAFKITSAMFSGPTAEISVEDASFIKERSGKITGALIHGRLCELLERAGQPPAVDSNGSGPVAQLATVE